MVISIKDMFTKPVGKLIPTTISQKPQVPPADETLILHPCQSSVAKPLVPVITREVTVVPLELLGTHVWGRAWEMGARVGMGVVWRCCRRVDETSRTEEGQMRRRRWWGSLTQVKPRLRLEEGW